METLAFANVRKCLRNRKPLVCGSFEIVACRSHTAAKALRAVNLFHFVKKVNKMRGLIFRCDSFKSLFPEPVSLSSATASYADPISAQQQKAAKTTQEASTTFVSFGRDGRKYHEGTLSRWRNWFVCFIG